MNLDGIYSAVDLLSFSKYSALFRSIFVGTFKWCLIINRNMHAPNLKNPEIVQFKIRKLVFNVFIMGQSAIWEKI